jgi:hypothetical protein
MSRIEIDYVGEGRSDDVIAKRMIVAANAVPGISYRRPLGGVGKASLDARLNGLNNGAIFRNPVLALRDLDADAACAPALVAVLLPNKTARMLLRVAVTQSEAWLMADREAYAKFCGLAVRQIPVNPESVRDPKRLIQDLGERGEARQLHKHLVDLGRVGVPMWGRLGEWHAQFAEEHWDPIRAANSNRSPSLTRALARLQELVAGDG